MNAVSRPCPDRELLLHGLADGELDAANALAVEAHLQNCGGCAAGYSEILAHKALLRDDALRFHAPSSLRGRIATAIAAENGAKATTANPRRVLPHSSQTGPRFFKFIRPAPAFSAVALAASLILFVSTWQRAPRLSEELVAGHVRSLLVSHLTDIESSDQHTVKPWFLGKLDFAPPVIDLAQKDYPLIGGRLDYIGGRVLPSLVYKRRGHVINLFVWPSGKIEGTAEAIEGYHVVSWTKGGFTYAAVSDLNLAELKDFQHAMETALS